VGPVAEGLVLGAAAPAQRAVLVRDRLGPGFVPHDLDAAGDTVRVVLQDRDQGVAVRVPVLHAVQRIAERAGGALFDGSDDLFHRLIRTCFFWMRTGCVNELCPIPVYTPRYGNDPLPCPLGKSTPK